MTACTGTFQGGATRPDTPRCSPYAAVGLLALAANVVLTRCCFACKETAWPVTISVVTVVLNVLLSLVWLPTLGARGLLLANSLSQTMQAVLLLMLTARLVPAIDWRALLVPTAKIAVSSLAMFLALKWIEALGVMPDASLASRAWFLFRAAHPAAPSSSRWPAFSTSKNSNSPGARSSRARTQSRHAPGKPRGTDRMTATATLERPPRFSVIVPAHNEQDRIGKTLEEYAGVFADSEIIVVLNGCTDATRTVVDELRERHANLLAVDIPHPVGKGAPCAPDS